MFTNEATWKAINELGEACKANGQIQPWFKYIPTPKVNVPHITAKQFFNPFSKDGTKFAFILLGFIIAGLLALCLAVGGLFYGQNQKVELLSPMSLAFTVGMSVEVVQMERTWNDMKPITGADFQDNQWGARLFRCSYGFRFVSRLFTLGFVSLPLIFLTFPSNMTDNMLCSQLRRHWRRLGCSC